MGEHPLLARVYRETRDRSSILSRLAKYELKWGPSVDVSLRRRLWLWRRGFTVESDLLFDIGVDNHHHYLSTLQHERAEDIGGHWTSTAGNKLVGHLLFSSYDSYLPDLYGLIENGTLKRTSPMMDFPRWHEGTESTDGDEIERSRAVDWIDSYLDDHEALVLKPVYGRAGNGVLVCRRDQSGRYWVNGTWKTREAFASLVDGLDEYLATEYVDQADYAEQLFPESTNTLRVLTYWDYETDEPFVGAAIQRIGTSESAPTDNWSNGGISAELSTDGTVGHGAQWLSGEGELRWFESHPASGNQIAGTTVPNWPSIREQVLDLASTYPYLPKVGWDILPTGGETFKILELNPRAGTRSIQVHGPLLEDDRVRKFYDHHDCL